MNSSIKILRGFKWLAALSLALLIFSAQEAQAATLYYYTYSMFENGQNTGFHRAFVHLYAIRDATDCWLYRIDGSNQGIDISTGAMYPSLAMVDGQPFDPVIIDGGGPGFGNAYFMLKSNYPMLWELGSDISGNPVDRDTFIISDNATFKGTRFFTFLYPEIGATGAASKGDIIMMHNPNAAIATVTVSYMPSAWTSVFECGRSVGTTVLSW